MNANNQSEVARLRAQIEQEYQAAQSAFSSFAQTAKHAFITARYERMSDYQQELAALVGEEASMAIVCDIIEGESPQRSHTTGG